MYKSDGVSHFQCPSCGQQGTVADSILDDAQRKSALIRINCTSCGDKFDPLGGPDTETPAAEPDAPIIDQTGAPADDGIENGFADAADAATGMAEADVPEAAHEPAYEDAEPAAPDDESEAPSEADANEEEVVEAEDLSDAPASALPDWLTPRRKMPEPEQAEAEETDADDTVPSTDADLLGEIRDFVAQALAEPQTEPETEEAAEDAAAESDADPSEDAPPRKAALFIDATEDRIYRAPEDEDAADDTVWEPFADADSDDLDDLLADDADTAKQTALALYDPELAAAALKAAKPGWRLADVLTTALIVLLLGLTGFNSFLLLRNLPQETPLFSARPAPMPDIALADSKFERLTDADGRSVTVTATFTNSGDGEGEIGDFIVHLVDGENRILTSWTVYNGSETVAPRSARAITSILFEPPLGFTAVKIEHPLAR